MSSHYAADARLGGLLGSSHGVRSGQGFIVDGESYARSENLGSLQES
jgi:hypothetical protein